MPSVFLEPGQPPAPAAVARALGPAYGTWNALRAAVAAHHAPVAEDWGWSGKAHGWSLKLSAKKRPLVYLIPGDRALTASLALGPAAWKAACAARFPKSVRAVLEAAPQYAEGRAVRLPVSTPADVDHVVRLVALRAGVPATAGARS